MTFVKITPDDHEGHEWWVNVDRITGIETYGPTTASVIHLAGPSYPYTIVTMEAAESIMQRIQATL